MKLKKIPDQFFSDVILLVPIHSKLLSNIKTQSFNNQNQRRDQDGASFLLWLVSCSTLLLINLKAERSAYIVWYDGTVKSNWLTTRPMFELMRQQLICSMQFTSLESWETFRIRSFSSVGVLLVQCYPVRKWIWQNIELFLKNIF